MRDAGEVRVLVELRWKCGEPVFTTPVDVGVGGEMLEEVVEPWKKIPPGVLLLLLLAAAYVAIPVLVGYADSVVDIVETAAPVGKAGRDDP
jgi:hypothetical protein